MSEILTTEGQLADLLERITGVAQQYADDLDNALTGTPLGYTPLPDNLYVPWFLGMVEKNPNWVQALEFVEGGPNELHRFERIVGLGPYAKGGA